MLKKIIFSIFLFFVAKASFATHIVGGEISYTHVAGNTYQVTLVVYRDDYNGNPGALFDAPAMVFLYNDAGVQIDDYEFNISNPLTSNDYIANPYPNPCLIEPTDGSGNPTITIQKGIYTRNITLPNGNTGYHLIYARCCRNGSLINNLTNPDVQGAKYTIYIPPTNLYNNNSPSFDEEPPIFVCLGSPLSYDQSATDIDGDSLVYSLCTPLQGLDDVNPIVQPGNNPPFGFGPPFTPVVWLAPYNVNNQLGGIPMTIDQNTGLISGTPNTAGSYVVGICVSEYRNGTLLSTLLRDFQYTVTDCNIPTAAIPIVGSIDIEDVPTNVNIPENILGIYVKNCENFNVEFENESTLPGGVAATALNATYWWNFGDGSTSTDFEPTHLFPDTGTYVVQLAITVGVGGQTCTDTGYYVVFVFPVFNPDFIADNVCLNLNAQFTDVSSTAIYDATNEWSWNFGDGTANSTTQNPSHLYSSSGTYEVILFAKTEKGCTKIDTGSITIHPMPNVNFANPTPICAGDDASFVSTTTILTGTIDSTYWSMGNGVISYSDSLNNYPIAGVYPIQLVCASNFGCIDSVEKNLTVNALPTIVTSGNDTICPNTSVQVSASGGVNYNWIPANIMNNANIFNPTATPTAPNYIYVEVTDGNNCVNNDSLYIDFLPLPPADAGEDTSVCLNISNLVVFNQSVPLNATGGISYVWTPTTGLNNPNISNPIATPIVNTDYIVTVTDANNCTNSDTVEVIVLNPALELIQVTTDSLCFGDTVYVDVLDQGAISSYAWSPVTNLTNPLANEPGFFPPVNTLYTLTVQNYCYQDEDSVLIEVIPIQSIDAGPLDSICIGDPVYQLNANPANFEIYEWTSLDNSISNSSIPNPTVQPITNSTYYLFVVDSVGTLACTNSDSVEILVFNNPVVNISTPIDYVGFLCLGDSVELTANTNDGILFNWDSDTTIKDPYTQNTYVTPISNNAEYFVTVTNSHACTTRDSIIIDVQSPIIPGIIGDSIMCVGFYVDLEATGGFYYRWFPENANFSNPNYSITQAHLDSSMQIFVDIRNDCFSDSLYKNIYVNQLPFVDAGADITIIRDDLKGVLNGEGDGKPLWYTSEKDFKGILNSPAQYEPDVQPLSTTTYVLEIENPVTGCKNYDTITVNVDVITLIAFPTGFSPNSDGTNDLARIIKYLNIKNLDDFSVYNRYGELIFTTTNIDKAWDGNYKGTPQEIGVYTWVIRATTKDEEKIIRKGNISLIR